MSIVYGGPGSLFFSDFAANYLLGIPITKIQRDDIPDPEVANKVQQVLLYNFLD